jgi:hypothetical protein
MGFGIAVGDAHGGLVALGDRVATEGKARGVERREAWLQAFLGTDSQSQLAKQQLTPIGLDCIERPAKLKAIEPLRSNPGTTQQSERFVSKKLGRERQRSIGKPQAIEEHPGYSFAWGDLLLRLRNEASVDPTDQAYVFYHTSDEP